MALSQNKHKALMAMLNPAYRTVGEIAEACGLAESTIFKYQRDTNFRKELDSEQGRMLAVSSTRLANGTLKAVNYLLELIDDKDASATNRRLSAVAVLNIAHKYTIGTEILNRIEAIEKALKMQGK